MEDRMSLSLPSLYAKCVKPRGEGVGQGGRARLTMCASPTAAEFPRAAPAPAAPAPGACVCPLSVSAANWEYFGRDRKLAKLDHPCD